MKHQTNKTKKAKQAKNLRHSEKDLGVVQTNYTEKAWEQLLHLSRIGALGFKLAHGTLVVKGISGSFFEIRFTGSKTTVLQLQHKPRGYGSRLLHENVTGNRTGKNGTITKRQASISEGLRSLHKSPVRLPKNWGKFVGE